MTVAGVAVVHAGCGGDIGPVERVVIVRPDDASWPRDALVAVAWCDRCRRPVDIGALAPKEE